MIPLHIAILSKHRPTGNQTAAEDTWECIINKAIHSPVYSFNKDLSSSLINMLFLVFFKNIQLKEMYNSEIHLLTNSLKG